MLTPCRLRVSTTLASSPGRSAGSLTVRSRPIGSQLYLGGLRKRGGGALPEQGQDIHHAAARSVAKLPNLLDHVNFLHGNSKTRSFFGGPPRTSGGGKRPWRQQANLRLDQS